MQKSGRIKFGGQWLTLGKGIWLKKGGEKKSLILTHQRLDEFEQPRIGFRIKKAFVNADIKKFLTGAATVDDAIKTLFKKTDAFDDLPQTILWLEKNKAIQTLSRFGDERITKALVAAGEIWWQKVKGYQDWLAIDAVIHAFVAARAKSKIKMVGDMALEKGMHFPAMRAYEAIKDEKGFEKVALDYWRKGNSTLFFLDVIPEKIKKAFRRGFKEFLKSHGVSINAKKCGCLPDVLTAAYSLSSHYDFGIAVAKAGLFSAYLFNLYGLPVITIETHREKRGLKWLDKINKKLLKGKKIIVFDLDVVAGETLRRVAKEIKKYSPRVMDLFLNLDPIESRCGIGSVLSNIPQGFNEIYYPQKLDHAKFFAALDAIKKRRNRIIRNPKNLELYLANEILPAIKNQKLANDIKKNIQAKIDILKSLNFDEIVVADIFVNAYESIRSDLKRIKELIKLKQEEKGILNSLEDVQSWKYRRIFEMVVTLRLREISQEYYKKLPKFPITVMHDPIAAFSMAKKVVNEKKVDVGIAIGSEGFAYAALFELLGFPVLNIHIDEHCKTEDRPYAELDDLTSIKGKNILFIEDDVQTGQTLVKAYSKIMRYHPKSVSVYLGISEGFQKLHNIPKGFKGTYIAPNVLSDEEKNKEIDGLLRILKVKIFK